MEEREQKRLDRIGKKTHLSGRGKKKISFIWSEGKIAGFKKMRRRGSWDQLRQAQCGKREKRCPMGKKNGPTANRPRCRKRIEAPTVPSLEWLATLNQRESSGRKGKRKIHILGKKKNTADGTYHTGKET